MLLAFLDAMAAATRSDRSVDPWENAHMSEFDCVILGGGIAGASLAWQLAGFHRVAILERETQCGYHTTGRSAALYLESYGPAGVRALTRASRGFLCSPPDGFAEVPLLAPRGALHLAFQGQEILLKNSLAELSAVCPDLVVLDAAAAWELAPCLRRDRLIGGLLEPGAQDMDVDALHQGYLRGARRLGAQVRTDIRIESVARANGNWRLRLADGSGIDTPLLVNATGAWADETARLCGARPVGVEPRRRSAFTFEAGADDEPSRWPALIAMDEGWYIKPGHGRLLGSPANADPTTPHDVAPEEMDIATAIYRIEEATRLTIRRPTSTWAGLRTFAPDGEMVIGFDPQCEGFFWLAGQGGYGIQSAPGASDLAACLIRGTPLSSVLIRSGVSPDAFSPARFHPT